MVIAPLFGIDMEGNPFDILRNWMVLDVRGKVW
jgi:hypothetical protein